MITKKMLNMSCCVIKKVFVVGTRGLDVSKGGPRMEGGGLFTKKLEVCMHNTYSKILSQ